MTEEKTSPEQDKALTHATVRLWQKRVKDAKKTFEKDFKRMQSNMEFAAGIQREGQDNIETSKYTVNFINKEVNQKVASLYARDPKAIARRRKRLDFQMWDGSVQTEQAAAMAVMQYQQATQGMPPNAMPIPPQIMQAQALMADIGKGKQWQKMVEKVGQTLEILYGYQCDTQTPDFKYQMKQLVRRVVTTGVGYVRLNFSRIGDHALSSSGTDDSLSMRIKRAKHIMEGIDEEEIQETDPRVQQLENLLTSVQSSIQDGDMTNVEERLEFDFPSATSILVDPRCKSLKGFVGARWVAQQFIIPLDEANAYFETNIKPGGELTTYRENGIEYIKSEPSQKDSQDPEAKPLVCIWELFDLNAKNHFFICEGWKDWVQEPQSLEPSINRFWPIFALTFNDCEVEPGCKVSIYPPSDVDLLKGVQKEWNRIGEELTKNRKGNRPFYMATAGWLTDSDRDKLGDHETCELVSVKGIPPNGSLKDNLVKFDAAPIDPALYNTMNLQMDAGMVVGTQTQNAAPQKHVAATPAMIQEQSRISGVNSNVDDLDDLLSELARAGGEMMLREFSEVTVKRIVGQGAVWPEQQREDFLNELFLDIVASSSGRPNKAVEIANFERVAPTMLQAGANPWAIITEALKRLDDRLDPSDFAPTVPPSPVPAAKPGAQHHPATGAKAPGTPHPMGAPAPMAS